MQEVVYTGMDCVSLVAVASGAKAGMAAALRASSIDIDGTNVCGGDVLLAEKVLVRYPSDGVSIPAAHQCLCVSKPSHMPHAANVLLLEMGSQTVEAEQLARLLGVSDSLGSSLRAMPASVKL